MTESFSLSADERETHLSMTGDDHNTWWVYTDDPYWIRRLDKIAERIPGAVHGCYYELEKGQVTLRKKRVISDAQRAKLRKRAQRLQNNGNSGSLEAQD